MLLLCFVIVLICRALLCHVWTSLRFALLCSGAVCRASFCCAVAVFLLFVVALALLLLLRVLSLFGCSELVCILRCRALLSCAFALRSFHSDRFALECFPFCRVALRLLGCPALRSLRCATLSCALLFYILLLCFVVVASLRFDFCCPVLHGVRRRVGLCLGLVSFDLFLICSMCSGLLPRVALLLCCAQR